ncbi:Zn(II)2Cys6 transcription factor [Aspergillus thermomutatus]|uniref:Zn(2)-C6 fungal-type domain-containing protein n=1 Tax=Aspergillus thermomutatus TaxID=41047 RepID=A0A397GZP9_ASPTH|nr:uncharacterized protein CDV56_106701 [Aspergillus thermomutatus]RHZ56157.1 hypothetical protein CDV56_106701 [Aspergillus thermomutatus]
MFSNEPVRSSVKSKAKCYTCRRQRIVCDAEKPSCRRCISRGVECLGYSATPIRWVAPTSTVSSETPGLSNKSLDNGQEKRKRGRPKLFLMQGAPQQPSGSQSDPHRSDQNLEAEQGTHEWKHRRDGVVTGELDLIAVELPAGVLVARSRSDPKIPPSFFSRDYEMHKLVLEFSNYFNDHVCPDLVIVDSPLNPSRMDLDILPHVPDFLLSLIISVCAIHQVIRSQASWRLISLNRSRALRAKVHDGELEPFQSFRHPLSALIYKHRSQSLRGLNRYLSEAGAEGSDLVFHTVTAMLMAEIQKSAFCSWKIHFKGLKSIIACQGGFEALVSTRLGNLGYALGNFMLIDVMSSVFMATSSLPLDTPSQLRYIDWLPRLHCDGLEKGFPCPNELLACIIHTNNLRWILQHHPCDDMVHVNSAVLDLVRSIITFSPTAWVERALESYNERLEERVDRQRPRRRLNLVSQAAEGEGWADLGAAFQAATLLYCLRALVLNHGKGHILHELLCNIYEGLVPDVQCLVNMTLSNLLRTLHPLMDQPLQKGRSMGRFMFWPVFMAGLESACSSEAMSERPFIVGSLQELCRCLGDLSALDAAVFLQSAWRLDKESHSGNMQGALTWDDLFERMGVHGLFFF